jgi:Uma2 family endonuclease
MLAVALAYQEPLPSASVVKPLQGQWTYEDYLQLPDDGKRYEIINGILYMANAPSYDHQFAVSELHWRLSVFANQRDLGVVLTSPFEIHLSASAKPVQPDVFFIAKSQALKRGDKIFKGVPDLIIEVLSPSSVRLDRFIKFAAYEQAKVPEYWIVDSAMGFVEVYTLMAETAEYELHGQFRAGEELTSVRLPELRLAVSSLLVG